MIITVNAIRLLFRKQKRKKGEKKPIKNCIIYKNVTSDLTSINKHAKLRMTAETISDIKEIKNRSLAMHLH